MSNPEFLTRVLKLQTPEGGTHREKFPDGTLSTEYTIKNGKEHGLSRRWHANGVLAEERHYRHGLLHGLAKQWNAQGVLLGTCNLRNGTGLLRKWYDNGQVRAESSFLRGALTGRMRLWAEDGMLYTQVYLFEWRQISKKRYLQKCKVNPQLPRFEQDRTTNTLGNYMRRLRRERRERAKLGPTPEEIEYQRMFDEQCKSETKEKRSKELLFWLTKEGKRPKELGESSRGESLRLGRRLYALGATKVWAINIERDPDGAEYSKGLIIALPKHAKNQSKMYQVCADPARPSMDSSSPAIAMGKRFMSVFLM